MFRKALALFPVILALAISACTGVSTPTSTPTPTPVSATITLPQEFRTLEEVWQALQEDFVDRGALDPKVLSEGAIRGMLEALGDPYTSYLNSDEYHMTVDDLGGSFEGIGAEVTIREGHVMIVAPLPDSPAERAGVRAGDIVLEVNGESLDGLNILQAVLKIRGPKGTTARLKVTHRGEEEPVFIDVVRDVIVLKSVTYELLPGEVGYVKVSSFFTDTARDLRSALNKLKDDGALALVLDLRSNPGGLLDAAVGVASEFLKGGIVLYELDGEGNKKEHAAEDGGVARDMPMVVLVDEFSASASEIVAGALQDRGRAQLIGTKTFGKGSVNILRRFSDGSGLYLTYARWYTPSGRLIEGEGLAPDISVERTQEDVEAGRDPQLDRALEEIKALIAVGAR